MKRIALASFVVFLLTATLGTSTPAETSDIEVRVAYLIGIGRYQRGMSKGIFRDLDVEHDIETLGNALVRTGFAAQDVRVISDSDKPLGSRLTYRKPQTSLDSLDAPVSFDHFMRVIENALTDLEESNKRGLVVFYFSGHGGMIPPTTGVVKDSERVLAFPNSQLDRPTSFFKVYELLNILSDRAKNIQKIVIVDACASPLQAKPILGSKHSSPESLPTHLFSSYPSQPSFFNPENKISLFTSVLADALLHGDSLGEGDDDGILDMDEIRRYIVKHYPKRGVELKRHLDPSYSAVLKLPWMPPGQDLALRLLDAGAGSRLSDIYPLKHP